MEPTPLKSLLPSVLWIGRLLGAGLTEKPSWDVFRTFSLLRKGVLNVESVPVERFCFSGSEDRTGTSFSFRVGRIRTFLELKPRIAKRCYSRAPWLRAEDSLNRRNWVSVWRTTRRTEGRTSEERLQYGGQRTPKVTNMIWFHCVRIHKRQTGLSFFSWSFSSLFGSYFISN